MYICVNIGLFLFYFLFSLLFILLPLVFLSWSTVFRVLSLFLGVVLFINSVLPVVFSILRLINKKKTKLKDSLTDKEFVDLLNYILLLDYEIKYRDGSFVLCNAPNDYFNNTPRLDTHMIVREYVVEEVDAIIDVYIKDNHFLPEYREAIIDYDIYKDLMSILEEDDFDAYRLLKRIEFEFDCNVTEF